MVESCRESGTCAREEWSLPALVGHTVLSPYLGGSGTGGCDLPSAECGESVDRSGCLVE